MRKPTRNIERNLSPLAICATLAFAGCATGNGEDPLLFGSSNLVGISIGGNATETGGEFVLGYKGLDVAVIPVSMVEPSGEKFLGAVNQGHQDSYSVIGQFGAEAKKSGAGVNAGLGKFFATGIAAQNIALGFAKKMGAYERTSVAGCKPAAIASADELNKALQRLEQKIDQLAAAPRPADAAVGQTAGQASAASSPSGAASPASGTPGKPVERSGARLIFAQYDYKALAIDGSALETGVKFTLGVRDRNIALIPMVGRDADGRLVRLESENPSGGHDVLSVLGQFKSDDSAKLETTLNQGGGDPSVRPVADQGAGAAAGAAASRSISSGLEKFFSTGAAATILSDGFKVKLCEEYEAATQRTGSPVLKTTTP